MNFKDFEDKDEENVIDEEGDICVIQSSI